MFAKTLPIRGADARRDCQNFPLRCQRIRAALRLAGPPALPLDPPGTSFARPSGREDVGWRTGICGCRRRCKKPRFRLYTAGHLVSVIGGWIQQVALAWLVFRLTQSTFLLGLTGFLLNIFYLLLGPLAGLAADRLPRLPALIAVDTLLAGLRDGCLPSWGLRASRTSTPTWPSPP